MAALSVDGTPMPALPNSADQINYDNTTSGMSATTVKGGLDELASEKQDKTDSNLQTTSNTVVGAINELKSGLMNETVLLNQLLTTTSTNYNLNGLVGDYMFVAFILGWYGNDNNDNMIVMPSSAFSCNDYLILYRNNDPATNAYAKINQRGYANGVNNIYAEGTEGVSIKVVGIIHK